MGEKSEHVRASRGWGAATAGVILAVVGFGIVLWGVLQSGTIAIPLNATTLTGAGFAAVGVGLAAIGAERGAPHYRG